MEFTTLIHSYACLKGMRRRYVSLVATPGLVEAHLLIFENETKWVASNPPLTSPCSTPSPTLSSPPARPVSESSSTSIQTLEHLLQADDGSRKGAKYVVRLEGLFYVGVNHVHVNGRLSVAAAIKSAFGKLVVGSKNQENQPQKQKHQNPPDPAGSAESYVSTSSTPGTINGSVEASASSQRPASICGLPSLNGVTSAATSTTANTSRSPTSLGLYFQDGSSTLMSFATPDLLEDWLRLLSAVVGTNRSRSGYPHIEYASTVTCRFKAKEFNSGPFPKIKGECLFCLSKLDVLLINQNIKQPDLSIRFPYVRNCASRDDGRLCLDIGRAAPTGECELVIQLPNAREAKAAHTRCIMLMRQCPTWLKLGRDGPSSRRRTLPNFGKKATGVNLAGPPLPRVPAVNASVTHPTVSTPMDDQRMPLEQKLAPTTLPIVPEASIAPASVLSTPPPTSPVPLLPLPDIISVAFSSHSVSHLIGRRIHYFSSLSRKSHSFPSRLCTEPIPEVVVVDETAGDSTKAGLRTPSPPSEEALEAEESPSTPTHKNCNSAADPNNHYLQLNVDNLMGSHIKSIAKYTVSDAGGGAESGGVGGSGGGGDERGVGLRDEMPSEETIHHVLAYLSSITRPSKAVNVENEPSRTSNTFRQPTVKFSPNPLMIPPDQTQDGFYVEPLIVGVNRLTTKVGSQSSEISRTSSTKKTSSGGVQLRRSKRCLTGYTSQGSSSLGVSSGGSGGSVGSNNRSRICSHRDNDELFADLTYAPSASSRHTTLWQMSKGSTCERSSVSFETGNMSMLEESCSIDDDGKNHKRPRTASDAGTKWKTSITAPIRFLPSSSQITDAVSRPRARSLTQQLATKPLSQPIGVKDLEGMPSSDTYNGCVQLGSRSSSTTSTSKSIRRALEHVLGRPRSTEERDGLVASTMSPSHHYNPNHQLQQNKIQLQDSEIYVEMDFPLTNPSHVAAELPPEMRNALRGSLLITPSDSLSSNSSCLSFYGGGGSGGRQPMPLSRNTPGVSFSEHYSFIFSQAVASTISASRTPFLMKPSNAGTTTSTNTAGCDIPSPTTAH
ncbi:hypothetical protein ECG_08863 [Echinococcus granulosus]|uniref:Pleckstrin y type n=1 Tax=Echinococcus granulosus TaxID=6210 RepID=A0A068X1C6_ECHGR|nr:hypothetical protein ECG_08863 [Echinococcus granulosus]CDS23727.1 Pleckstrin y type [Echinococcus granulosus]